MIGIQKYVYIYTCIYKHIHVTTIYIYILKNILQTNDESISSLKIVANNRIYTYGQNFDKNKGTPLVPPFRDKGHSCTGHIAFHSYPNHSTPVGKYTHPRNRESRIPGQYMYPPQCPWNRKFINKKQ